MDKFLVVILFEVVEDFEEGIFGVFLFNWQFFIFFVFDEFLNKIFEEVMSNLINLIGLEVIKKQVKDYVWYIQFL